MDPILAQSLVSAGSKIGGEWLGSEMSETERRRARQLMNERGGDIQSMRDIGGKSVPLATQMADYASGVGTVDDSLFHGGLAATKFKDALGRSFDEKRRDLGRYGLPGSGKFMNAFGGTAADRALMESSTFNDALLKRINEGMNVRKTALNGIATGQQNIQRPMSEMDELQEEYEGIATSKMNQGKDIFNTAFGGGDKSGGAVGSMMKAFGI